MTQRCMQLLLTSREPAVFSARSATEGVHVSLSYPPGASLLGWLASAAPYGKFENPFDVFHSGRVTFSNAFPLVDGACAYPVPQLLMQPKHGAERTSQSQYLDRASVQVGRDRAQPDGGPQLEALKGILVTESGRIFVPRMGSRLRTATSEGRAAAGQLFGYSHIEPGKSQQYAATIEVDDGLVSEKDWQLIVSCFSDCSLFLGRGAGASYGGDYACKGQDLSGERPQREAASVAPGEPVRVWTLSDLALIDDRGAPCFEPSSEMLGLPEGGRFLADESAIQLRRYSPWNGKLRARDIERQVIAAGSVLSYAFETPCANFPRRASVGLWREGGLGQIHIAPQMLSVPSGAPPEIGIMHQAIEEHPNDNRNGSTSAKPGASWNEIVLQLRSGGVA